MAPRHGRRFKGTPRFLCLCDVVGLNERMHGQEKERWMRTGTIDGITPYHAKYFAYMLTRLGGSGMDRLTQSLLSASIDLTPHQIEAALFALRSPLGDGVLLADEVGLGKTIEAGIVLCQLWAENKRRLLVLCPAALRKQWQAELKDKFNLDAVVLDAKSAKAMRREGVDPFSGGRIVIASYHYVWREYKAFKEVQWNLVVIDEAHKLRNAYRTSNKIGQAIRFALESRRKLLLTATPFQNQLSELYGLTTLISPDLFGDLATFRSRYSNVGGDLDELKARLSAFCRRALRSDDEVKAFVKYTDRKLLTVNYTPTVNEEKFYNDVTAFLRRNDLYSIPQQLKSIMLLGAHEVLASSPAALIGTFEHYKWRLNELLKGNDPGDDLPDDIGIDEDEFESLLENGDENAVEDGRMEQGLFPLHGVLPDPDARELPFDEEKIKNEIEELDRLIECARSLGTDTKTRYVLKALDLGWQEMRKLGGAEKAVIFTESRRSMKFLREFLNANGYAGEVVCFSGGGRKDPESEAIYREYVDAHPEVTTAHESHDVVMRHALVNKFRRDAKIFIATEAGAEGINLQFCSLLLNYDLPWNPQRIEQRIGRCHRYGQLFDVVIVNFLNTRNAAEARLLALLQQKYSLFGNIFGVSDHVLVNRREDLLTDFDATIGFEKKILDIMNTCRTPDEINAAFDRLRDEKRDLVNERMAEARDKVLANLADEVQRRLKIDPKTDFDALGEFEKMFWDLTRQTLGDSATFSPDHTRFRLNESPAADIPSGEYIYKVNYRLNTPLGQWCLETGKNEETPDASIRFNLTEYGAHRLPALQEYVGKGGYLTLEHFRIESLESEDHILTSGVTDSGKSIDPDVLRGLFKLKGTICAETQSVGAGNQGESLASLLSDNARQLADATLITSSERTMSLFDEEVTRLENWAKDMIAVEERELALLREKIVTAQRTQHLARTVEEKLAAGKEVAALEKKQRRQRMRIFEIQDKTDERREAAIEQLKKKLNRGTKRTPLFTVRWELV